MPLFAVVLVLRAIRSAFAWTLLVSLVFRIIPLLLLVLEKGSRYRDERAAKQICACGNSMPGEDAALLDRRAGVE
jgi:hypothetical protein